METRDFDLPGEFQKVNVEEVRYHLEYIQMALDEPDTGKRKLILIDAFLSFGLRFTHVISYLAGKEGNIKGQFEKLKDQSKEVLISLLSGKKLTGRVDEEERRALLGLELLKENNQFQRIAAVSLLALPEGHPMRDLNMIKQSLLRALEDHSKTNDYDGQVLIIKDLLSVPYEKREYLALIQRGNSIVPFITDHSLAYEYYLCVIGHYVNVIRSEDQKTTEEIKYYTDNAFELIQKTKEEFPGKFATAAGMNLYAVIMTTINKDEEALDSFVKVLDGSKPDEDVHQIAAKIESRFRMDFQQYERVIQILTPIIPYLEEKYLLAVEKTAIEENGESYYNTVWNLAYANAYMGNWNKAVEFLERGKSRRLLYQGAIRNKKEGQYLLSLEKKLYIIDRNVDFKDRKFTKKKRQDWFAKELSLKSKIQEEYRLQRKSLPVDMVTPSIEKISSFLDDNEAVITVGLTKIGGTLLAMICKNDREMPAGVFLDKELNFNAWIPFFSGGKEDGWLFALGAPEMGIDHKPALLLLMEGVEKLIGEPLKKLLAKKNLKRLTIIPHHWLHVVPFWALPCLAGYEVSISGSAAHFIDGRQSDLKATKNVLVVSNTTSDLPCTIIEAAMVRAHLLSAGYKVKGIEGEKATEKNIVKSLKEISFFHFSGHGRSDMDHPTRSSLMVATDITNPGINKADPFKQLLSQAGEWKVLDNEHRGTNIPGTGYLYEKKTTSGDITERILEAGDSTSVLGLYYNGQLDKLMEMWSAGDIMVQGSLNKCSLAFLSACEVGAGSMSFHVDEYAGLPAALQLAGVKTVICSLWPVEDVLASLYVDLFYRELSAAKEVINVAAIVKNINNKIRTLTIEESLNLLNDLSGKTKDKAIQEDIDNYISLIKEEGEKYPFSHPIHWASFYVTGASHVRFAN